MRDEHHRGAGLAGQPGEQVHHLLTGPRVQRPGRLEEARALRWAHVDLDGDPAASPPIPPHVAVWRSVRAYGETKTERSRRTLALPRLAAEALRALRDAQDGERLAAGQRWQDTGLVFTTHRGAALDAGNVRKMFKRVCTEAGAGDGWTPRELRTTFVSLMSHHGVSTEEIARLAGHASTRTTEVVYRRELRPVITTGAQIMDQIFGPGTVTEPSRTYPRAVRQRRCPVSLATYSPNDGPLAGRLLGQRPPGAERTRSSAASGVAGPRVRRCPGRGAAPICGSHRCP